MSRSVSSNGNPPSPRAVRQRSNFDSPTVVDLFAGAGLLSHSFAREGFQISLAIENDVRAAETYRTNLGDHVVCADVAALQPHADCDVLIGGPPCQGFSTLGKRAASDPRNQLPLHFARWARVLRPKVVAIENVEPFPGTFVWKDLATKLEQLGFTLYVELLDAFDFGAAQKRRRSFTIASRIGPIQIEPLTEFRNSTVRDAWRGLPERPNGVNWHYAPKPSRIAKLRMQKIPLGGGKIDLMRTAPELCPPSWWSTRGALSDVWGRLRWNEPSNTLRTCLNNASKGRYIHPDQDRVISLREAARLQSIPDDYQFTGFPKDVACQIGNSVPPALGRAVAHGIRRAMLP